MTDWASEYFERGYAQRWGLPPVTDNVRLEVDGIWARCGLSPAARVVDLGCGHGRHAIALAARGGEIVGVDSAAALIDHARRLGHELRLRTLWVRGDMRRVPLQSRTCDAAVILDAFGFFDAEDDNAQVLREAARVLKPGAATAVKLVNGAPILADFRHVDRDERDGVVIAIDRTLTHSPPRMIERISIDGPPGGGRYERRQRLYRAEEISEMLRAAGFANIDVASEAGGGAFDSESSPTMWIVARRATE
jgi:ubiquinone/menaquinone biosynthesis C-methylase UbiE